MAPHRLRWLVLFLPVLVAPIAISIGHQVGWDDPHHPGQGVALVSIVGAAIFAGVFWVKHSFEGWFTIDDDEAAHRPRVHRRTQRRRR